MASSICIAISGPSSSGKTTVSRLLRSAFTSAPSPTITTSSSSNDSSSPTPHIPIKCTILHGDDFYIPDSSLPLVNLGDESNTLVQDWDCPEALDFPRFISAVKYAKLHGELPEDHATFEDTHAVGVDATILELKSEGGDAGRGRIEEFERQVREWLGRVEKELGRSVDKVVIVDGFLLFGKGVPVELRNEFDLKFMIRTPYEKAKSRREARAGYTTMEGFWHDPPRYFELLVWPAYLREHSYLFQDGDLQSGILTQEALDQGIRTPLKTDQTLMETLEWAVGALLDHRLQETVVRGIEG